MPDTQLFVDDRNGRIVAYSWVRLLRENDRTLPQAIQPAWVSIACGAMRVSTAHLLRQMTLRDTAGPTLSMLNVLSDGPQPFYPEYF